MTLKVIPTDNVTNSNEDSRLVGAFGKKVLSCQKIDPNNISSALNCDSQMIYSDESESTYSSGTPFSTRNSSPMQQLEALEPTCSSIPSTFVKIEEIPSGTKTLVDSGFSSQEKIQITFSPIESDEKFISNYDIDGKVNVSLPGRFIALTNSNVETILEGRPSPQSYSASSPSKNYPEFLESRKLSHYLRLAAYIFLWYLCSALGNNINKIILKLNPSAVILTWSQFLWTALFAGISIVYLSSNGTGSIDVNKSSFLGARRTQQVSKREDLNVTGSWFSLILKCFSLPILKNIAPLTGFLMLGHILTSQALSLIPVSFVHTIKGSAPLFTVLISRLLLKSRYSVQVYRSLLPLTTGIMLACVQDFTFHYLGFFFALCSTLTVVLQNLASKSIFQKQIVDTQHYVFYSSFISVLFLGPFTAVSLLLNDSSSREDGVSSTHWLHMLSYYGLSGISHYGQNVFALSVLNLVNPVTYSIASLGKRLIVISASIFFLGEGLQWTKVTGIALSLYGIFLYNKARVEEKLPVHNSPQASKT